MRRRDVLAGLGATAAAAQSAPAAAQDRRRPARIGFLALGSAAVAERRLVSLREGLSDLGTQDGRDYVFALRTNGPDRSAMRRTAEELVGLAPDVIVTHAAGTAVLKALTRTIPIVMVSGDAVTTGLVASLSRPGGNVTGVSFLSPELVAKRLELLRELSPSLQRAGLIALADYPVTGTVVDTGQATARTLGMSLRAALVRGPGDLAGAFSDLADAGVGGVVVQDEPMLIAHAGAIAGNSTARGMVSVGFLELARQGGHLGFSIDFDEVWRRAGRLVGRILAGSRTEDLPVEQPTRFELVLNAKALKAAGIDVPPSILARADEVID
jgi:putative ABC transport system substrate-binding protein